MSRRNMIAIIPSALCALMLGGAYALAQDDGEGGPARPAAGAAPAAAAAAAAAPAGPVGPFTQAQVTAGRQDYLANCAGCHSANLSGGGEAPALTGATFMSSWGPKSTKDFYAFVSTAMPYGNAGNLSPAVYQNLIAFIYAVNGAAPGTAAYTAASDVKINTITNGRPVAAVIAGTVPAAAAAARPPVNAFPLGHTVVGDIKNYTDVTDEMLKAPSDNDWLMYRRNYYGWSYSPLKAVTTRNVSTLQQKWAWGMVDGGAVQSTPIIHDGIMFLANPNNTVQALDAKTGTLLWENRLGPLSTTLYGGNRALGVYKGMVFSATYDAKLHALDARTGKEIWVTTIDLPRKGETGGVMVINGKVLVGLMGCDNFTVNGCYISAYDYLTGKRTWMFRTTPMGNEPGAETWNGLPDTTRGGGDTWIAGTYDPDLNTTYWGVAQTKPWFRASRKSGGAATLYSTSTLALNPDDGKLKWYFQHTPGESLDLDVVFERVLINHGDQKVAMTMGKDGLLWKLDRVTGKFLAVRETVFQNVFQKINHETGEVTYRDDILNQKTGEWFSSCPGPEGGKDWMAMSYHQPTDTLIIPESQSCVMIRGNEADMKLGGGGTSASQLFYFTPGSGRNMGRLFGINARTMKTVWTWQQQSPFRTAVLSTAGGVAFVGDFDRQFRALDVKTGKILWESRLGQTVQGHPVSYSVDGKQYIAVTTGTGGGSPEQKPATLLPNVRRPVGGTAQILHVFALPDR